MTIFNSPLDSIENKKLKSTSQYFKIGGIFIFIWLISNNISGLIEKALLIFLYQNELLSEKLYSLLPITESILFISILFSLSIFYFKRSNNYSIKKQLILIFILFCCSEVMIFLFETFRPQIDIKYKTNVFFDSLIFILSLWGKYIFTFLFCYFHKIKFN